MEYWECPQQLADRCARGGALCTARRSPAIPYRRTAFFGQKLPITPSEYDHVSTPAHPKLMELYETAFITRGNTPPELSTRYKSLVGGLIFPVPTTRIDCLFAVGMHARAMDCATEDVCALHIALYGSDSHGRVDLRARRTWRT